MKIPEFYPTFKHRHCFHDMVQCKNPGFFGNRHIECKINFDQAAHFNRTIKIVNCFYKDKYFFIMY